MYHAETLEIYFAKILILIGIVLGYIDFQNMYFLWALHIMYLFCF